MGNAAGKVAVVLGASAENGIGWACAKRLADEGAKVVVAARSYDRLCALAGRHDMLAVKCDATSRDDIERLAETARREFGRIDIAVNSAGAGEVSMIADTTEDMLLRSYRMNFIPMFNFVQIMAAAMGERTDADTGSIVLVSTMSVTHPMPGVVSYATAKGATDTLVRYAALEFGPGRIKVNSINPGFVLTDLARNSLPEQAEAIDRSAGNAAALRRTATPADCADAVFWLATSGFVTGINLIVSGGGQLRPQFEG